MRPPNAHELARIAGDLLAAIRKAHDLAGDPQFRPDSVAFAGQLQRIRELLDFFVVERARAGDAAPDYACDLANILDRELVKLSAVVHGGKLDFAEGSALVTYHVQRAKAGTYDSARWLNDNLRAADSDGRPVDPVVRLLVPQMQKGGLRKSRRMRERGKRGHGRLGDLQLFLAREMWKQHKLAACSIVRAADKVAATAHRSCSYVRNAYYRFQRGAERRLLYYELTRDFIDDPQGWRALARRDPRLEKALTDLQGLRPGANP